MVAMKSKLADLPASDPRPLVLCVDDEGSILSALARALRGEAYRFETTDDPELALDWVRTRSVSLILADYRMRGISGTSLLQMVKAASPRTIRILLTGSASDPWVCVAQDKGLMNVFGKPWDDEDLRRMIRDRLEHREGSSEEDA